MLLRQNGAGSRPSLRFSLFLMTMLVLLAESKTMNTGVHPVDETTFLSNTPFFEEDADHIASYLRSLPLPLLKEQLSLSESLTKKAALMFYDFPNKTTGIQAIEAFTGEVFRSLDFNSLDKVAKDMAMNKIGFISSLYGYLRPKDIIKPYRLDFNSKIKLEDKSLSRFWKSRITGLIIKILNTTGEREILDLLPGDAYKYIDWKRIPNSVKVLKIDFKTVSDGGELSTPQAGRLKDLRGLLCRHIFKSRINDFDTLLYTETEDFCSTEKITDGKRLIFLS